MNNSMLNRVVQAQTMAGAYNAPSRLIAAGVFAAMVLAGQSLAFQATYDTIDTFCAQFIAPAFVLAGIVFAVVNIFKGIMQLQNEENGWRTIIFAMMWGGLSASVPVLSAVIPLPVGVTDGTGFCKV